MRAHQPVVDSSKTKATKQQTWKFLSSWESDDQQQYQHFYVTSNSNTSISPAATTGGGGSSQYASADSQLTKSVVPVDNTHSEDGKFSGALTVAAAQQSLQEIRARKSQQQPLQLLPPISSSPSGTDSNSNDSNNNNHGYIVITRHQQELSPGTQQLTTVANKSGSDQGEKHHHHHQPTVVSPRQKVTSAVVSSAEPPYPATINIASAFTGHNAPNVVSSFLEGYQKQLQLDNRRLELRAEADAAKTARREREEHMRRYTTGASGRSVRGTYSLFSHNPPLTTGLLRSITYDKMETASGTPAQLNPLAAKRSSGGGDDQSDSTRRRHYKRVVDPLAAISEEQRKSILKGLDMPMIPRSMIPFLLPRLTYRPPASSVVSKELLRVAVDKPWLPLAQEMVLESCIQTAESVPIGPGMKELVVTRPGMSEHGLNKTNHSHPHPPPSYPPSSASHIQNSMNNDNNNNRGSNKRDARENQKDSDSDDHDDDSETRSIDDGAVAVVSQARSRKKTAELDLGNDNSDNNSIAALLKDPAAKITVKEARPPEKDCFQSLSDMVQLRQLYLSNHPPADELRLVNADKCPEEIRQSLVQVKPNPRTGAVVVVPAEMQRGNAEFEAQKHQSLNLTKSLQPMQRLGLDNNSGSRARRRAVEFPEMQLHQTGGHRGFNAAMMTSMPALRVSAGPSSPMEDPSLIPSLRASVVSKLNAHEIKASAMLAPVTTRVASFAYSPQQQQQQQLQLGLPEKTAVSAPAKEKNNEQSLIVATREARLAWLRKQQHEAEILFGI